jgi:hypothetical protein
MRKERIVLLLGIWVAALPYLGFPYMWKNVLFTLSGLGLVLVSYLLYRVSRNDSKNTKTFDNFSENQ